jgi:hypothetical protein
MLSTRWHSIEISGMHSEDRNCPGAFGNPCTRCVALLTAPISHWICVFTNNASYGLDY